MYIFDYKVQKDQPAYIVFSKLYGIGLSSSKVVCSKFNILLTDKYSVVISLGLQESIEKYIKTSLQIGLGLKRILSDNVNMLISSGSLRGFKHQNFLPVRNQRTKTNAMTIKKSRRGKSTRSKL